MRFLLVILIFLMSFTITGQVSGRYSFSSSSGTYTPITGGVNYDNFTNWTNAAYTGTLPNSTAGFLDDAVSSALLPIGFNFSYNGTTFTQFGICTNGWISLGALPTNSTSPLGSGTSNNVISALGNDLIGRGSFTANRTSGSAVITITAGDINLISVGDKVGGNGIPAGATVSSKATSTVTMSANATNAGTGFHFRNSRSGFGIRYQTIGTAPNRTLVVQWTGWQRYTTSGAFGELYNFQIRLSETTNTISFVYDISGPTSTTSNTYQIGLRGSSSSDYDIRTTTSNWSNTTAATSNLSTVTLTNTVKPASGLTYTWTPIPVPSNDNCAGAISVSVNSSTTCTSTTNGTSIGATQTSTACSATASGSDDDVWYSFVATNTSHVITVTPGTMSDVVFQVFSGTCAGLSSLMCVDNTGGTTVETTTLNSLSIGTTYLMRVHSYAATSSTRGTFTICITTPCTTPTNAGTVSLSQSTGTVNDNIVITTTGNGGTTTLLEFSYNNFTSVAGSFSNPANPYNLRLNVYQTQVWFRTTSQDGTCPASTTSPVSITLNLAPPYTNGTTDGDYISNVSLNTINNNSTNEINGDAYQNFKNISTTLLRGSQYTINVTGTYTFGSYPGYAAWADWDQDGTFEPSENILLSAPMATGSNTFTVPVTSYGNVFLRVLSVWNATPQNDAYYSTGYGYGEIEEYTIDVAYGLPVELIYFDGVPYPTFNLLKWSTASEHNSDYFEIERSVDGENWKVVGKKLASGNSNQVVNYSWLDSFNDFVIHYYRLKQVDYDGQFKIYGPIALDNTKSIKKIVKYVNTLGQEVNPDTKGIIFEVYEDGTMKKIIR